MIAAERVARTFRELFGGEPRVFEAPGRVNLIGEHTDYNDGFVLPVAIDRGTLVAGASRADRRVVVHSVNEGETVEFDLDRPGPPRTGRWTDYVEGTAQALEERGVALGGASLVIESDVPIGSGLSSSAALEIATGLALSALSGDDVDGITLAKAGQSAEHRFVGTRCGIMDQFASALSVPRHALLIDCRTLESQPIPIALPRTRIVICDSGVRHGLATSEYNTRRAECARGVELLRAARPEINALRDVTVAEFDELQDLLPEPIRRRCRHVVTENERTLAAARAFAAGRLADAGRLMNASHASMRDDFEITIPELDTLVEAANSVPGCAGSRMTGGGFGGSTVSLVDEDALAEFEARLRERYRARMQRELGGIFVIEASAGAREVMQKP